MSQLTPPDLAPDLSVIIVSWNVRELLCACLASVFAGAGALGVEVIVVDNASSDGSVAMVRRDFPRVHLLALTDNVGFPRGNNLGMAAARGRYWLLLNPDTEVVGDALAQMVAYADATPDVGVVGPQLQFPDGRIQSSRRRFPLLVTSFVESTWLQPLAPPSWLHRYYALDLPDDQTNDVDWVTGACMLVRADVAAAIGGMDEAYFMYSEELDWCRRLRAAGWRVVYLPAAVVIHHEAQSSDQASTARHINFNRSKLRYVRRYHGPAAAAMLRLFLLANFAGQLLLESIKWVLGHKRSLRRQRVGAYWAVLRSGLPPAGQPGSRSV